MPPGRPTALTDQLRRKIIAALKEGVPREMAISSVGISRATFYSWLSAARQPDASSDLAEFLDEVEKAEDEAVATYVKIIKKAAPHSWQAAAWMLERRWPDMFGRKDRVSIDALKRTEAEKMARELGIEVEEVMVAIDDILSGRD